MTPVTAGRLLLSLLLASAPVSLAGQTTIAEGKLTQLMGKRAGVALPAAARAPALGDSALLYDASLPGEQPIPVRGRWKVVEVAADLVWLEAVGEAVAPVVGYLARIHSSGTGTFANRPSRPETPDTTAPRPVRGGDPAPSPEPGGVVKVGAPTRPLRERRIRNFGTLAIPHGARVSEDGGSARITWQATGGEQSIRLALWPVRSWAPDARTRLTSSWDTYVANASILVTPAVRWRNLPLEGKPQCWSSAGSEGERTPRHVVIVICPADDPEWLVEFEGDSAHGVAESEEATLLAVIRSYVPGR